MKRHFELEIEILQNAPLQDKENRKLVAEQLRNSMSSRDWQLASSWAEAVRNIVIENYGVPSV